MQGVTGGALAPAYAADIRTFSQFLSSTGSEPTVEAVTVKTVRDWMAEMASRGLRASTLARRLSGRSMYHYLMDCEIVTANPCQRVRSRGKRSSPPSSPPSAAPCWTLRTATTTPFWPSAAAPSSVS